jgi:hypothetical protein
MNAKQYHILITAESILLAFYKFVCLLISRNPECQSVLYAYFTGCRTNFALFLELGIYRSGYEHACYIHKDIHITADLLPVGIIFKSGLNSIILLSATLHLALTNVNVNPYYMEGIVGLFYMLFPPFLSSADICNNGYYI